MRKLIACAFGMSLVAMPFASAQDYPDRPVRIIVPVAAGGGVDVMARMLAQKLSERWKQQFVVENRPGAAGVIGTKAVTSAPPDGYTLLYTPSSLAITVLMRKTMPYDVMKDLTPIINVAVSPYALVVNAAVPAKNLKEFIAHAKANPNAVSYSSAGVGSASHLAGELLKNEAGIQMQHIPNKGMNPALIDLLGGQVQALFASVPSLLTEKSDRVRPIAMAEKKRSALMPDMPTIDESGLPGFEVANWVGLLGPAGMDPKVVKALHDEIAAILDTADMKERLTSLGYDKISGNPQEFSAQIKLDIERWGAVVQKAGIQPVD